MMNIYEFHTGVLDYNDDYKPLFTHLCSSNYRDPVDWTPILHVIKKDTRNALYFAKDIMKGRWLEAEPYIMKDPYHAYYYASAVIKGRWTEAEPYIMTDTRWAYHYAIDVMKKRWLEAEPLMKPHRVLWVEYSRAFKI